MCKASPHPEVGVLAVVGLPAHGLSALCFPRFGHSLNAMPGEAGGKEDAKAGEVLVLFGGDDGSHLTSPKNYIGNYFSGKGELARQPFSVESTLLSPHSIMRTQPAATCVCYLAGSADAIALRCTAFNILKKMPARS